MRYVPTLLTAILLAAPVLAQQPVQAPVPSELRGLKYDVPFFPGATHDPAIPTPDSILGFPVGERPARHAQIEACLKAWSAPAGSPRTRLVEYARTHEKRALYYLVISSEANIRRLDAIKTDLGKLADQRNVSEEEARRLADSLPAVAWMAYTIHGDEMSGSDAALALAWHLVATQDAADKAMLDELVIIIDPLMNPDGRDRYLDLLAQNRTAQPSVDDQSVLHSRPWPAGRTNHYLFDLNRDWLFGVHPETRGRLAAIGQWRPQLLVDAHEMSSADTYLFSPPREPTNANFPAGVRRWWGTFSKDQAAALDRFGWRYFTGEWNEELYPGYSTSLNALRGTITMLYEQASIATDAVRKPEGTLESYREAVHHQLVSSMANLATLRANRREILRDYAASRRQAIGAEAAGEGGGGGGGAERTFAVVPSENRSRMATFLELMRLQGVEVYSAADAFEAPVATDRLGQSTPNRRFAPGTWLIPVRQPEAPLVRAMLDLDPRLSAEVLTDERRELLRFGRSRMYDITGWNLLMLHDVEGYSLSMGLPAGAARVEGMPAGPVVPRPEVAPVAWAIDGADDRSVAAAGRLMEREVRVRVTDKPTELAGRAFPRGTVFVTRADNKDFTGDLGAVVTQAASELELAAWPVATGMGPGDLPDIGGEHFVLLDRARIAVLSRAPVGAYAFGEVWHLLDHVLGLRASYIDADELGGTDLRRYNVLVLPAGSGPAIRDKGEVIKAWVKAGGTLIAVGSAAGEVAKPDLGITGARTLPDVVTKLDDYTLAVVREWEGREGTVDAASVWSVVPPAKLAYPWAMEKGGDKPEEEEIKRRDAWRKIFMPQGAIVAGRVDDRSFLTAGCGGYVPILFDSDTVLMAASPVQAPVRLGAIVAAPAAPAAPPGESPAKADVTDKPASTEAKKPNGASGENGKDKEKETPERHWAFVPPGHELRLRMSGLLWPEAADRLAGSAYVTRESVGNGQVILFASSPTFRGAAKGTMRVFSNAVVYGPGMGASQPVRP